MTDGADDDALPGEYALIDVGGGARLERFGERLVDRPSPGALGQRRLKDAWLGATCDSTAIAAGLGRVPTRVCCLGRSAWAR
jgi:hypothetical protein